MQPQPFAHGTPAPHAGVLRGLRGLEAPWLAGVNPGFMALSVRQSNCENTALAVNEWLAGNPLSALPEPEPRGHPGSLRERLTRSLQRVLRRPLPGGEHAAVELRMPLDRAYGGRFEAVTLPLLEARLALLGEGARGIVRMLFSDGRHHHFNAAVHDGHVLLIDGQVNRITALDAPNAANPCTLYAFTREQSEVRARLPETNDVLALKLQVAHATRDFVAAAGLLHDYSSLAFMRTDTLTLIDLPSARRAAPGVA